MRVIPWERAWHQALYGPQGFYRRDDGPAAHFTTSCHGPLGAVLAEVVAALADEAGATHVVDIGCGRGELLIALHARRPDLALTGVDIVERPDGLPKPVSWLVTPPGELLPPTLTALKESLVLAHEWLDVIACPILQIDEGGRPRVVLVDPTTGQEAVSTQPPSDEDLGWCQRHWPLDDLEPGDRIEVGRTRDDAWDALVARLHDGVAIAVDYGHGRADRPRAGTLTAYRGGVPGPPIPDGASDLTAHVAMDALIADVLLSQAAVLARVGLRAISPHIDQARTQPGTYLAQLARASALRALSDPVGLGSFAWVLRRVPRGSTGSADGAHWSP